MPPPPPPRGTAGRSSADPPPYPVKGDVWDNVNVLPQHRYFLMECVPEWFCEKFGLGADGKHILEWRTAVERYLDRDPQQKDRTGLPKIQNTSVEAYLKTLRLGNQRTGESVIRVAQAVRDEKRTESFQDEINNKANDIITQQHRSAKLAKMAYGQLPAHAIADQVLGQVNAAMDTLDRSSSSGIVLVTGGTGTGKSSVLPGYIYLKTIEKAETASKKVFTTGELRPGGRIMITQPRKALAKTMSTHLKTINKQHKYLFGYHYSGHASSSEHQEPILYMTEGITVAILMTWVSRVMTLVKEKQRYPAAASDKGGTSGLRAGVSSEGQEGEASGLRAGVSPGGASGLRAGAPPKDDNPWNPEFQVIIVDECHLRSVQCDVIIALTRWLQSVGVPVVLVLMSATANEEEFMRKLRITPARITRIVGDVFPINRFCLADPLTTTLNPYVNEEEGTSGLRAGVPSGDDVLQLRGALQAVVQIIMRGELWSETGGKAKGKGGREQGRDVLVFLPGTAEITLLATTLEFLIKAGYITGVKVYKINARVDQETLDDLKDWPDAHKWKTNYANPTVWARIAVENQAPKDHMMHLVRHHQLYQPRRILLSTEAVNAGITLPKLAWVISSMGVRRVYYDPRREIRVNVLAPQTKA
eukprot:6405827-Amphidinium_carterae.5